jgi:fibronectin type 3 domain-containing protein
MKIVIIVLLIVTLVSQVKASTVELSWLPNSESNVIGYRVYYGNQSYAYTKFLNPGNATVIEIGDLTDGNTYYFAVTAFNSNAESDFSDEVSIYLPLPENSTSSPQSENDSSSSKCFVGTTII